MNAYCFYPAMLRNPLYNEKNTGIECVAFIWRHDCQ